MNRKPAEYSYYEDRNQKEGAIFSPCRRYRYVLWRRWCDTGPNVFFIGLNPSTADECQNDPTIRRCLGFARRWQYGSMCVANLFAYCATKPDDLKRAADPTGPENRAWLTALASNADLVIACWGNMGVYQNRSSEVQRMLGVVHCLRLNGSGEPAHPLYLKSDLKPTRWC